MLAQTIALFRYLWRGIIGRRFFVLVGVLLLVAVLSGTFLGELAIIRGDAIVAGFVADFLRYGLVLLVLLMVAASVADDYEFRQFERLLSMPLSRWQYIAAQALVIAALTFVLVMPVLLLMAWYSEPATAFYWAAALWLELFLVGLLGLLAIMSLEKVPAAVFFALAVYLLAKLSGLIGLIVEESVRMAEGSAASRVVQLIFEAILYVMPDSSHFARNDVFFTALDPLAALGQQALGVLIYGGFLVTVCLVDFYRKEFNL
ncbi:MAG: hypothetical protein QNJ16_21170 [Rhodobacter sp.]|nr:hypothetical protein [Gammaproteobacteria bacterium]MDJ0828001.1 hypothetical protein [Rhodobacter sp.]